MSTNDPISITASGLACRRGGRLVFRDLAFLVASGQLMTLIGPNGAGKSSLLRILAGLLNPSDGAVTTEMGGAPRDLPPLAHYVGHQDAIKPALSVIGNLQFWIGYCGGGQAYQALETVGLGGLADFPAGVLSAGQRRRLALSRLIAVDRPVWLLDEPTSALDKASEARLGQLLTDHVETGGIVIAATHLPLPRKPDLVLDMTRRQSDPARPAAEVA